MQHTNSERGPSQDQLWILHAEIRRAVTALSIGLFPGLALAGQIHIPLEQLPSVCQQRLPVINAAGFAYHPSHYEKRKTFTKDKIGAIALTHYTPSDIPQYKYKRWMLSYNLSRDPMTEWYDICHSLDNSYGSYKDRQPLIGHSISKRKGSVIEPLMGTVPKVTALEVEELITLTRLAIIRGAKTQTG